MPLFLDLLDNILGKDEKDVSGVEDARIIGVGQNGIAIRLPDNSASAQVRSRSLALRGLDTTEQSTRPAAINLDGLVQKNNDGTVSIDFTSLGGQRFNGTEAELGSLRGDDLFAVIGNAALQAGSAGTINSAGNLSGVTGLLGGQATTTQIAQPDLSTQQKPADVKSLFSDLKGLNVSEGLNTKLTGLNLDDSEREEFIELFRAARNGG